MVAGDIYNPLYRIKMCTAHASDIILTSLSTCQSYWLISISDTA